MSEQEEHVSDTNKRKRVVEQQKSYAFRQYFRNAQAEAGGDVKSYIEDVDALQKWENSNSNSDPVKTVSRVVQSMEVMALESIDSMLSNKTLDGPNTQQHIRLVLLS